MKPENNTSSKSDAVPGMEKLRVIADQPTRDLLDKIRTSISDVIQDSLNDPSFSDKLGKLDALDGIRNQLDDIQNRLKSVQQDLSDMKNNYDQFKNAITTISWEDQ